jgi:hypothetical protein
LEGKKQEALHDDENMRKVKLKNHKLGEKWKTLLGYLDLRLKNLLLVTGKRKRHL